MTFAVNLLWAVTLIIVICLLSVGISININHTYRDDTPQPDLLDDDEDWSDEEAEELDPVAMGYAPEKDGGA